jgi:anti-anti-sigma factor
MSAPKYQLFQVNEQDGVPVLTLLLSELRTDTTVRKLEEELEQYLRDSAAKRLVVDMSAVHYVSSSGLRALIVLRKRLREVGGRFTMCGVHAHVADVFKTTRLFSASLDYLDDPAAAVAALKSPPSP